jgi:hypothetical protein
LNTWSRPAPSNFTRGPDLAQKPFFAGAEQNEGKIHRIDKDYLHTLETETLSEMAQSIRQITQNVASLSPLNQCDG